MFSIYAAAYNVCKFSFDYEKNIRNWSDFVGSNGEIIIAVNKSEDNTLEELIRIKKICLNVELVQTEIPYSNNRFDGLIKQAALSKCKLPIRCLMDLDEYFPPNSLDKWEKVNHFLYKSVYDGVLIPVIDLWGDRRYIKKQNVGQKFRIHKKNIRRGVWKYAELKNGFFDTSKSDSTEPILENGELANFVQIVNPEYLKYQNLEYLKDFPYIVHEGYLDFNKRVKINSEFWKGKWEERSGHKENVITSKKELEKIEIFEHGLKV
jgi:hypothetical protein